MIRDRSWFYQPSSIVRYPFRLLFCQITYITTCLWFSVEMTCSFQPISLILPHSIKLLVTLNFSSRISLTSRGISRPPCHRGTTPGHVLPISGLPPSSQVPVLWGSAGATAGAYFQYRDVESLHHGRLWFKIIAALYHSNLPVSRHSCMACPGTFDTASSIGRSELPWAPFRVQDLLLWTKNQLWLKWTR